MGVAAPLTVVLLLYRYGQDEHRERSVSGAMWIGRLVALAIALTMCTRALAEMAPSLALFWLLTAAATTPAASDMRRTLTGNIQASETIPAYGSPVAVHSPHPGPIPAATIETMSDTELCRAWRRSFWTLRESPHPVHKLDIVQHRQRLLEELEARNPTAMNAWMTSGARACSSPQRFFTNGEDD